MGGSVEVESKEGEGSKFNLTFIALCRLPDENSADKGVSEILRSEMMQVNGSNLSYKIQMDS